MKKIIDLLEGAKKARHKFERNGLLDMAIKSIRNLTPMTPEEWRIENGLDIIPDYLPCYTRRNDNDCWHLDWYLSAIQDDAYCNEFGTSQIYVVDTRCMLRQPNGLSIKAGKNEVFKDNTGD
jgi:hypothetical protein